MFLLRAGDEKNERSYLYIWELSHWEHIASQVLRFLAF